MYKTQYEFVHVFMIKRIHKIHYAVEGNESLSFYWKYKFN